MTYWDQLLDDIEAEVTETLEDAERTLAEVDARLAARDTPPPDLDEELEDSPLRHD